MPSWKAFVHRVRHFGRGAALDRELEAEIRFHVETRADELERTGLTPAAARSQAVREFGSRAAATEDARAAWQFAWLESLRADVRYALRGLRRSPAFTITAMTCLALGLGATSLIFSVVNAVLLAPLPYPDAERLVVLRFTRPNQPDQVFGTNTGAYFTIREQNHVFESVGAGRLTNNNFNVADDSSVVAGRDRVLAQWLSPDMIRLIGVQPRIGRWPGDQESFGRVFGIAISHGLWQRVFGGRADVVGRKLRVNGGVATVVGVMPSGFELLSPADFWIRQPDEDLRRANRSPNRIFTLIARLKPGVGLEQAQADMNGVAAAVAAEYPEQHTGWSIRVEPIRDAYVGSLRRPLLVFQGAVLFVLLIASANVAGLQMAQAAVRHRELAMRAALGSSRGRLARQLLTESVLLSLAGGVIGIGLASVGLRVLARFAVGGLARFGAISLDRDVAALTLLVSTATGLVFGVLPAIHISRTDLMEVLRDASRGATAGRARQTLRGAFLVLQVALALVLLVGAGLAINSLFRLSLVKTGFDPHGLLTVQVTSSQPYSGGSGNTPAGGLLVDVNQRLHVETAQIVERLAALPGVEAAALTVTPPLGPEPRRVGFTRDSGAVAPSEQEAWTAEWYPTGPGYFRTIKAPLLRGREFGREDSDTANPVAVINQTMARQFWPNEDPIGQRIQMNVVFDTPREIVGIVSDVRQNRYQPNTPPQMYFPRVQFPKRMDMAVTLEAMVTTFLVRTDGDPSALVPSIRAAIADVNPTLAVAKIATVEAYGSAQLQDLQQFGMLLSIFGGVAIALAAVGLFGMTAHAVSQRAHEIGIRRALGAGAGAVLGLVLGQGVRLVVLGLAIGTLVAVALTRFIATLLWGVTATDPLTFLAVAAVLAATALAACYLPARRALKIDPLLALRSD